MFYLGIDVGAKGGLSLIKSDSTVIRLVPYSNEELKEICDLYKGYCKAILEDIHYMPRDGGKGAFSFGKSFGYVLGVLEACEIPYQLLSPQKWQKEFSIHSKEDSIAVAERLHPGINLLPTERSRKKSDGMADAINLSEYARRHMR